MRVGKIRMLHYIKQTMDFMPSFSVMSIEKVARNFSVGEDTFIFIRAAWRIYIYIWQVQAPPRTPLLKNLN